ncbi:cupin domain-containing protein [Sphingorhabdus sp. Alg231-15]|uniref:cupin domain-containing protein n=1 Tax=Sphingorhabdus sp. Alg231-15 TaxID=1922222 RepID=UPI000D560B7F
MQKSSIISELDALTEFWSQKILTEANGSLFKVAKGIGSTHWHKHDDQDELFIIFDGEMKIEFRTGDVTLGKGEMLTVPKGIEHRPSAEKEVRFLVVGLNITSTKEGGKPN